VNWCRAPVVIGGVSDGGFGFAGVGADRPHTAVRVATAVLAPAVVGVVRRVDEFGTRLLGMVEPARSWACTTWPGSPVAMKVASSPNASARSLNAAEKVSEDQSGAPS